MGIKNCASDINDEVCMVCNPGYGIGGKCSKKGCSKCIKCGSNCRSCRKCLCTECESGKINPNNPSECIKEGGVNELADVIRYQDFQCGDNIIKFNIFLILIILLLLKKY